MYAEVCNTLNKNIISCNCQQTKAPFENMDMGKVKQTITISENEIPVLVVDGIRYYQMESLCNVFGIQGDLKVIPQNGMFSVILPDNTNGIDLTKTYVYLNGIGIQALMMNYLDNLELLPLKDKIEITPMEPNNDVTNGTYANYRYGEYPATKFPR